MKFNLEKKTTLIYSIAWLAILTLLLVYYTQKLKLKSTTDLVDHAEKVLQASDKILLSVVNYEASARGYYITKEEQFLDSCKDAIKRADQNILQLAFLTRDNSFQNANLRILKKQVKDRLLSLQQATELRRSEKLLDSELRSALHNGKIKTDNIRSLLTKINSEEFRLLKQKKKEQEGAAKSSDILFWLFFTCCLLVFVIVVFISNFQRNQNYKLETYNRSQKLQSQYSRSLIEASLDPLVTISKEGKITDVNAASTEVTGLSREELIGTAFSDYFTKPLRAEQGYHKALERGFVTDYPLTIRHKNGSLTDVLYNASVYRDEGGKVIGVFAAARDITAIKKIQKNLEKSLKEISAYKFALDESCVVAITDRKGIITQVNDNFCAISKYSKEELIGQDHRLINSGFHSKEFITDLWKTIQSKNIWRGEIKNKAKDGSFYWVDTTIVPFTDAEGQIYQYMAIRIDITNTKQLSQYSLSLIEASRDPLFTIDPDGKITDLNAATMRVTGLRKAELIGTNFSKYFTNPARATLGCKEVFSKGFIVDYDLTIIDGKLMDVLFNGSVYKDDKGYVIGAVLVARDITEQKRNEKELIESKLFAELATEMAEHAKGRAEKATEIAENAVKAKQQFLSNMSHEIRTPMNAIIGFTKVILKTDLSLKQQEYLTAIKISGDALIVLINDILDLAKVDAGKMNFENVPFKLSSSVSAMLQLFENKTQEKNIILLKEYDEKIPLVVLGDPMRLHQIILNLLSNAVKFTHSGNITLRVHVLDENEKVTRIKFTVSDTGIGIAQNKLGKIFEDFQQASSGTSRLFGGTGLGLAIVKQLVELQGGIIEVKSTLGKGSHFSFSLNFEKTELPEDPVLAQLEFDAEIKNIKVLVVEDIALNQLLMKTLLDDFGFERDIAGNGRIAIEKLGKKSYDIILMDLQMPIMNGFEATEYIRNEMNSQIPIIALTADVTTVDLEKCKTVGMNDYLSKPVDAKLLYTKIVNLVKKPYVMTDTRERENAGSNKKKYINLNSLEQRTKSNPLLIMEMISLYLEQTPALLLSMKQSLGTNDWETLYGAAHKMLPSFSIMGIGKEYEDLARNMQEKARAEVDGNGHSEGPEEMRNILNKLEVVSLEACSELEKEFTKIKKTTYE